MESAPKPRPTLTPMSPTFDLPTEYARLGVPATDTQQQTASGSTDWRLETTLNADYTLCATYPRCLAVPASASLDLMREVAAFRTRGRLPVLCWRRDGMGALLRGSQPGAGVLGRRSAADEHWFRMLGVGSKEPLALLDCRPLIAAVANRFKGGGTESRSLYEYSSYEHLGIANVHAVKSAARQAYGGDTTAWLKLQSVLLRAAARTAELLSRGVNVLLHCSDGWDRTPQVSCLAQLLLDGHYRTRRGFALLIEKEWLAFGHKFATRRALGMPIFVQFLDAVEQLRLQNAAAFEFNEFFLLALAAAHDGESPSGGAALLPRMPFEADCERERAELLDIERRCGAEGPPPRVWELLIDDPQYANPSFAPSGATTEGDRLVLDHRPEALRARVRPHAPARGAGRRGSHGSASTSANKEGPTLEAGSAKESAAAAAAQQRGRSSTMQAAKDEATRDRSRTVATTPSRGHAAPGSVGAGDWEEVALGDYSGKGAIKVNNNSSNSSTPRSEAASNRSSVVSDLPSSLPPSRKGSGAGLLSGKLGDVPDAIRKRAPSAGLLLRKRSESSQSSGSHSSERRGSGEQRKRSETPSSPHSPFNFMPGHHHGRRTDIEDDMGELSAQLRSGDAMMLGVGAAARERGITMGEMI